MSQVRQHLYMRVYEAANSRLRYFAGGRFASRCRPTWISFLLTERCNARCCHCDIWKNRGKEDNPTPDQWKAALSDLRDWLGPVHVCITGGEALLIPSAVEVIRHGCSIGLHLEILTHGYWQEQSRVEAMARAKPWRITLSVDGLGEVHSRVRGREGFHERTFGTIQNLIRMRREEKLGYSILLKTVIMRHNLDQLSPIAAYAAENGLEVFYQPIEQNYNTKEDPRWFDSSPNWPTDPDEAVRAVEGLIALKRQGFPIENSLTQLEVMIPYFKDPASLRLATQGHSAHDKHPTCAALSLIQVQSNGDVRVCAGAPPVGNIKMGSLRKIWAERPQWWRGGCCLDTRMTPEERHPLRGAVPIAPA
ncbi:MAG TPA: radical SAM protein [Gemmatimonadales bacterium]|nr:radical SAM protein [Gemmatimonadales bacterium]